MSRSVRLNVFVPVFTLHNRVFDKETVKKQLLSESWGGMNDIGKERAAGWRGAHLSTSSKKQPEQTIFFSSPNQTCHSRPSSNLLSDVIPV